MPTEPIQRRKLYQEVLDRLLERIRSGEIPSGEQLPSERELMDSYQVGRPAIREALQSLERSGIVTINHGERARVAIPTAESLVAQITSGAQHLLRSDQKSLEHLKEVRIFLECGMARKAAENSNPESMALLRQRLADHHRQAEQPQQFVDADIGFHTQIAAMSGNPIFPVILEAMLRWLGEYYQSLVRAPGAETLTLAEHDRIVDAIEAHDAKGAEVAMREHLTRANSLYQRLVRGEPGAVKVKAKPRAKPVVKPS
jgi:GntR family transcriptional regulator, sialic acid-inducible nan operon repressor